MILLHAVFHYLHQCHFNEIGVDMLDKLRYDGATFNVDELRSDAPRSVSFFCTPGQTKYFGFFQLSIVVGFDG